MSSKQMSTVIDLMFKSMKYEQNELLDHNLPAKAGNTTYDIIHSFNDQVMIITNMFVVVITDATVIDRDLYVTLKSTDINNTEVEVGKVMVPVSQTASNTWSYTFAELLEHMSANGVLTVPLPRRFLNLRPNDKLTLTVSGGQAGDTYQLRYQNYYLPLLGQGGLK